MSRIRAIDGPWSEIYRLADIQDEIECPEGTIIDSFRKTVEQYPHRACIKLAAGPLTVALSNAEVYLAAWNFAAGLAARDLVRPGDVVAIREPNVPQAVIAALAIWLRGGTVLFMYPLEPAESCAYKWNDVRISLLITMDTYAQRDAQTLASIGLDIPIIASHGNDCFPFASRLLATPSLKKQGRWAQTVSGNGTFAWREIMQSHAKPSQTHLLRLDRPDGIAMLVYTTGTSGGKAKAAMWSHAAYAAHATLTPSLFTDFRFGGETIAAIGTYHHSLPSTVCLAMPLATGTTIAMIPEPYRIDKVTKEKRFKAVFNAMERFGITILPGVPGLFMYLVNDPDFSRRALRSLRYCISGASRLSEELRDEWERKADLVLCEGYGMSEMCSVITVNSRQIMAARLHFGLDPKASLGAPIVGVEVRICDDAGNQLPAGQKGMVMVRGPGMMLGYFNRPKETAAAIRDGWLATGDRGFLDSAGCLTFAGRDKYNIKGNDGHDIDPEEIEPTVESHPAVREAAIVRMNDPERGEVPHAIVVLKAGNNPSDKLAAEIISFCKPKLGYRCPRKVSFAAGIPRSMDGIKILRGTLEELYSQQE